MKRLNLGCGPKITEGWDNVDTLWKTEGIIEGNPLDGFPVDWANSYDYVVAHHVLQEVTPVHLVPWLSEVRRILKPGGALRVSVPDVLEAFEALDRGEDEWFPIADEHAATISGKLCWYLSQGGNSNSFFTPKYLGQVCIEAGFSDVQLLDFRGTFTHPSIIELDSRPDESIFLEAVK